MNKKSLSWNRDDVNQLETMFLRNLPIDIREQAAVERRRRQEKERLLRFFNVKYRTIGVSVPI